MDDKIHIRKRIVCLSRKGRNTQAAEACSAIYGIKGVFDAHPISQHRLSLTYSLEYLSFDLIEDLLGELGFYMDNSIFAMLRRNIYQYLEDNAREKMHVEQQEHKLVCDIDGPVAHDEPEKYWSNYC